jgi:hypothetical protein
MEKKKIFMLLLLVALTLSDDDSNHFHGEGNLVLNDGKDNTAYGRNNEFDGSGNNAKGD